MLVWWEQRIAVLLLISVLGLRVCLGQGDESGSCPFSSPEPQQHHHHEHHCDHGHHQPHQHDHHHQRHHHHEHHMGLSVNKLAEELAEEEDLKLYGFGSHHGHHDHGHDHDLDHDHHHHGHDHLDSELSSLGLWIQAMGCSLLVSMASLVCLIILPVIFFQGKPSKAVVDSLAAFGAGAMLGDAFLHQLPHAFGGGHSHSHDHHADHTHDHLGHVDSHSHSLKDLSVGLSILSGIVLFLLVEKLVRYVEASSGNGEKAWGHGHHHHHHKSSKKDDNDAHDSQKLQSVDEKDGNVTEKLAKEEVLDGVSDNNSNDENCAQRGSLLRKRTTSTVASDDGKPGFNAANDSANKLTPTTEKGLPSSPSNLVFGYLNLFSDGVHNFTDGMALGSAFLLNGSIGGWSRTLFLLAHELPQEVGDFGILVRSGFSVTKALFFNFLSALVALAGTALALLMGRDPGQSSLIEGFTAGGFIYIAVAGVLPEMNSGNSTFRSSAIQLFSLILGMAVALCISLVE